MRVVQFFWGSALQDRAGRPGGRPLRRRYKGCDALSAGGQRRLPLRRVARSACVRDDVGIVPYGEHCMKCGEAGRRGRRPLRKRIMGCVGEGLCPSHGRGRTPPLRRRYKGCGALSAGGQRRPPLRRVARSACVRDDVGIVPYGSVTRNAPQVLAGGVEPRPYGGLGSS